MTAMNPYQSPGSTAAGVGQSLPKAKEYSASLAWARGPLSLGLGYDFHQGLRPVLTTNGKVDPKDTGIQIGAKWNFGPGEIGVGYEQLTYDSTATGSVTDNGIKVPAYVVNGRWNIGPGAVWASYSGAEGKSCANSTLTIGSAACGAKAKMYSIGYDYVLSKRTKLYVAYNKIDNGTAVGTNGQTIGSSYYYIAGPAANTAPSTAFPGGQGTNGGLAQGTDVTTMAVGIQHVF
jgi:predicted porin